jgi:ribonucleoside-diphosphate reductase alpha chain
MTAYKSGLKGITVYREGSREGILVTEKEDENNHTVATASAKNKNASKVTPTPRGRPVITNGVTRRIRTGEGSLYITINEDQEGLCEVFTTIGKAGGNAAAQSEAISRLISLALRSGVNPNSVVRQLKGISGPNPTWEDGRLILSTPDAIGKALDDYLREREQQSTNGDSLGDQKPLITMAPAAVEVEVGACEEGSPYNCSNLVNENGCMVCRQCGWSKCD